MKYNVMLDNNPNDAANKILKHVKPQSTVLEFGCANGRMTRYMQEVLSCKVYIVEIEKEAFEEAKQFAVNGICCDIASYQWEEQFKEVAFDHILFADVLEHLSAPEEVLKRAVALMKPSGSVLVSVPNIAHNDVIYSLIHDRFHYTNVGLLDNTHIHFFAYHELPAFFQSAGLEIISEEGTIQYSQHTEQSQDDAVWDKYGSMLRERKLGNVYQFVICAMHTEYVKANGLSYERNLDIAEQSDIGKIYFDTGSGFHEDEMNMFRVSRSNADFQLSIRVPVNTTRVRIDPVEGYYCTMDHMRVWSNEGDIEVAGTNAVDLDGHYVFSSTDPWFLFQCNLGVQWIKVSGCLRIISNESDEALFTAISDYNQRVKQQQAKWQDEQSSLSEHMNKLSVEKDIKDAEQRNLSEQLVEFKKNIAEQQAQWNDERSSLSERINKLSAEAEINDVVEENLRDQIAELKKNIAEQQTQWNDERSSFVEKINMLSAKAEVQSVVEKNLHDQIAEFEKTITQQQAQWNEERASFVEKIYKLSAKVEVDDAVQKNLRDQIAEFVKSIADQQSQWSDERSSFMEKIYKLSAEAEVKATAHQNLRDQIAELEKNIVQQQVQWNSERSSLVEKINKMSAEAETNIELQKKLSDQTIELKKNIAQQQAQWNQERQEYSDEISSLQKKVEDESVMCKQLEETLCQYKKTANDKATKNNDLQDIIKKLHIDVEQLNEEKKRLLQLKGIHEAEKKSLFEQVHLLTDQKDNVEKQLFALVNQIKAYEGENAALHHEKAQLSTTLKTTQDACAAAQRDYLLISNSDFWKLTKPARMVTGKMRTLLGFNKPDEEKSMVVRSLVFLKRNGMMNTIKRTQQEFSRNPKVFKEIATQKPANAMPALPFIYGNGKDDCKTKKTSVSIVIPTKNGGPAFGRLLTMLRNQEGFNSIEIVIVDSGSTDQTLTYARRAKVKIIQIKPEEFSHSYARNLGVQNATSEYLMIMTQDAMPTSTHWLYNISLALTQANNIGAVSCMEYARYDSDLYHRVFAWNHYKYLGVLEHNIFMCKPSSSDMEQVRKNAQLSDITCMMRRETALRYPYQGSFAEDLDLGMRLINDGYRLGFLSGEVAVHSHNRPAYYYLRRRYVEFVTLKNMFPEQPIIDYTFENVVKEGVFLLEKISGIIENVVSGDQILSLADFRAAFNQAYHDVRNQCYPEQIEWNDSMASLLDQTSQDIMRYFLQMYNEQITSKGGVYSGSLLDAILGYINICFLFMETCYEIVNVDVAKEFKECIGKIFTSALGTFFAYSYFSDESSRSIYQDFYKRIGVGV